MTGRGRPKGHPRSGGRKKGTPNKATADLRAITQEYTAEIVLRLVHWMRSDEPKASTTAAGMLLERGWGRPAQAVTGEDGGPLTIYMVSGDEKL